MTFQNFTLRFLLPFREEFFVFLALTILYTPSYATTWIVQPGAGGHFVRVQDAIDGSTHGDTILVEQGIYYENINFNGKNVVLTSRYLFTEDEYDINNTILDGDNAGRVVTIENGESREAQFNGFTVQHGFFTLTPEHQEIRFGAGIFITSSSPRITNCTIKNNHIPNGGSAAGIGILYYSAPLLSNLSIHDNWAANGGGGIGIGYLDNYVEWDPINKCSIYNNYAGYQNDIAIGENYSGLMVIPLDTFSVSTPDEHFTGLAENVTLTIEQGYFPQVSHDLYVSPSGNDSNPGTSFEAPLKTIQHALAISESDSLIPSTIFLSSGTYSATNGQYFPLNLKSFVSIQGAGKSATILDGEDETQLIMARYDNYYEVSDMTISHAAYQGSHLAITVVENIEAEYRNLRLTENNGGVISMLGYGGEGLPHPMNSSILLDSLEIINNTCRWTMYIWFHRDAVFQNSVIRNSQPVYDEALELNLNFPLQLRGASSFEPQNPIIVKHVEVSNNTNMDAFYPGIATGVYVDGISAKLINCTIADNQSTTGAAITLFDAKVTVVNSILYGNDPNQFYLYNPLPYSNDTLIVQNCIAENGEFGIHQQGENTIHWLDNNQDADPWFQGGDTNPYYLAENSPAIDAGTDFFVWEGDTIVNMSPDEYVGLAPDIGAYEYYDPNGVVNQTVPVDFELYSNFPNPFNGSTLISFTIPNHGDVDLTIYNVKGQEIQHQSLENLGAGTHRIKWEAENLPSGLYIYEINYDKFKLSKKALLVK